MNRAAKWWHAQFNLGWRSFLHYLKKLWPWHQKSGLEQFKRNYISEGLLPYSVSFRKIAFEPSRCTTCGMCDSVCPALHSEQTQFLGPMRLVVSAMRGGPLSQYAMEEFTFLSDANCISCQKCEKACPEQIPILSLTKEFVNQWHARGQ